MADWDSDDLLQLFKNEAGLQAASEYDDDDDLFPRLSRAQTKVIRLIASRYPSCLYQAPVAITSTDGGFTFGFGNDASGNPVVPMGWVQIATTKSAFSGDTFVGWVEGRDFSGEGAVIRLPSNRTYTGSLFARFVPTPPTLTASTPSVLNPADARNLIVLQAVKDWAGEGNIRPDLVDRMSQKWADEFPSHMLSYRRMYRGGGALLDPARWYFGASDLGSGNSRY